MGLSAHQILIADANQHTQTHMPLFLVQNLVNQSLVFRSNSQQDQALGQSENQPVFSL